LYRINSSARGEVGVGVGLAARQALIGIKAKIIIKERSRSGRGSGVKGLKEENGNMG
jgi:hypothetical protein